MKAMILAGGLSTRLYPLTKSVPKPLVPVGDRAVLEILIRSLVAAGIHEIGSFHLFTRPDTQATA